MKYNNKSLDKNLCHHKNKQSGTVIHHQVFCKQKVDLNKVRYIPWPGVATNDGHVIQNAHTPHDDLILPVRRTQATSGHLQIPAINQEHS